MKDEDSKLKREGYLKGLKEHEDIRTKEIMERILTSVNLCKTCKGTGSIK